MEKEVEGVDFAVPNFPRKVGGEPHHFVKGHSPIIFVLLEDGDEFFTDNWTLFLDFKDGFEHIGVALGQ
jgi:hypothetical protein